MAQFIKNTDKSYPCTQCGVDSPSIIREDPKGGSNPRLRCGACGFMYDGKDSLAATEAGAIKPSSEDSLAMASEPEESTIESPIQEAQREAANARRVQPGQTHYSPFNQVVVDPVPERPAYVFVSKDRKTHEFCTKKDLHPTAIRWSVKPHNVYELAKLNLNVKVEVATVK